MSESKSRMREERDFAIQLWHRSKSALETIASLAAGEPDAAAMKQIAVVAAEALPSADPGMADREVITVIEAPAPTAL